MRSRLALAAALVIATAALAAGPQAMRFLQPNRSTIATPRSSGAGPWRFCDQLSAGDKSGNYECVNGDGTQGASSTHSFSAVGSPAVTAGTTCAAAAYTTMVAASNQSYRTPTFTASTGDQTICALVGATTAEGMWSVGEAGTAVIDQQGAVTHSAYANPAGGLCSASNSVPGDATPVLTCAIWDSVAHQVTYFVGPNNVVNGSGCSGALSATTARVYFGCSALQSCASHSFGGKFFGGFWSGTKLSTARLTAINALVTCQ